MSQISLVLPDGSMQDVIEKLMARAGLPVVVERRQKKSGRVPVDWISQVFFQRPQEIPIYLAGGHFDAAIVGEDWIRNWDYNFPVLQTLAIGRGGNKSVRIVVAIGKESGIRTIQDLPQGCEIATEYAQLAERFFAEVNRTDIVITSSYGNTEGKTKYGATGVVEVVESGDSLIANDLVEIHEIMISNTVVVANSESYADEGKRPYIDCFSRLIGGANRAMQYVMIIANVPDNFVETASRIMGGLKGPSCSMLTVPGWVALQSIVPRQDEHKIIFNLLNIGVTDILVNREIALVMI